MHKPLYMIQRAINSGPTQIDSIILVPKKLAHRVMVGNNQTQKEIRKSIENKIMMLALID